MDKRTVSKMLENAGKDDLIEIISNMSRYSRKAETCITDWCISNNEKYQKRAVEMELERHWEEARAVIQEFNEYGGGPEYDEEDAYGQLRKMDRLLIPMIFPGRNGFPFWMKCWRNFMWATVDSMIS